MTSVGERNLCSRLQATRRTRRMPWHQVIARLTVFAGMWMLALWWVFFL